MLAINVTTEQEAEQEVDGVLAYCDMASQLDLIRFRTHIYCKLHTKISKDTLKTRLFGTLKVVGQLLFFNNTTRSGYDLSHLLWERGTCFLNVARLQTLPCIVHTFLHCFQVRVWDDSNAFEEVTPKCIIQWV